MSNKPADKKPSADVAKKVVAQKRKYFVPEHGEIEATSLTDAQEKIKKMRKAQEEGDANS